MSAGKDKRKRSTMCWCWLEGGPEGADELGSCAEGLGKYLVGDVRGEEVWSYERSSRVLGVEGYDQDGMVITHVLEEMDESTGNDEEIATTELGQVQSVLRVYEACVQGTVGHEYGLGCPRVGVRLNHSVHGHVDPPHGNPLHAEGWE